jgi:hypothetical protein
MPVATPRQGGTRIDCWDLPIARGDPGHAAARAAYESVGFTALPIIRDFKMLWTAGRDPYVMGDRRAA